MPVQQVENLICVVLARLLQVAQYEYGPFAEALDVHHVANHGLGSAVGGLVALEAVAEGRLRRAADDAVLRAAADGEDGGDGVLKPALERQVAGQVAVAYHGADDVVVVADEHVVEIRRSVGQRVLMYRSAFVAPGDVGHIGRIGLLHDTVHEALHRLLGGVAAHHVVDLGIVHQLAVEVR